MSCTGRAAGAGTRRGSRLVPRSRRSRSPGCRAQRVARICCRIPRWSGSAGPTRPWESGSPRWTPAQGEPRAERIVDAGPPHGGPDRGGGSADGAGARSGAERGRADGGRHTRLPRRVAGIAVGLLLPGGHDAARLPAVETDLQATARRRAPPAPHDRAGAGEDPGGLARVGVERGSPAGLPARAHCWMRRSWSPRTRMPTKRRRTGEERFAPVRVIGVSGRGDRRLLHSVLPNGQRSRAGGDGGAGPGPGRGRPARRRGGRPAAAAGAGADPSHLRAGERAVGARRALAAGRSGAGGLGARTEVIASLAMPDREW